MLVDSCQLLEKAAMKRVIVPEIESKISETKAELLKWMIVLFAPFYVGIIVFLVKQFI